VQKKKKKKKKKKKRKRNQWQNKECVLKKKTKLRSCKAQKRM